MTGFGIALVSALIGSVVGPVLLTEYQRWRRERSWAKPRKELLLRMLNDEKHRFKSIDRLARTAGCTHDECRSLLIELGARGAKLQSGNEGWALISRAPLSEDLKKLESETAED